MHRMMFSQRRGKFTIELCPLIEPLRTTHITSLLLSTIFLWQNISSPELGNTPLLQNISVPEYNIASPSASYKENPSCDLKMLSQLICSDMKFIP